MSRILSALIVLLIATAAYPCGGKYVGRNAILNTPPAVRPASILILNNQSLRIYSKSLKSTLMQLGHKVREVKSSDEMVKVLKSSKKYDIVMADMGSMGTLAKQIQGTGSGVMAVPLVPKSTKKASISAEDYPFVVNLSSKSTTVRKTIEKAMEAKAQEAQLAKEKA